MNRNTDLIKQAFDLLSGKWLLAIAVSIIAGLLSGVPQAIDEKLTVLNIFITGAISVGTATFFLRIVRGQQERLEDIFEGFKTNYTASLVAVILTIIIVMLGFVLLIVPGIILALGLSQTFYILADDKQISGIDAMKKSWSMMDGYKVKYFLLCLLYIGMAIAGALALIIGLLFVIPLIQNTNTLFYEKLKAGELVKV
jgi:uncharacterized membrane protein